MIPDPTNSSVRNPCSHSPLGRPTAAPPTPARRGLLRPLPHDLRDEERRHRALRSAAPLPIQDATDGTAKRHVGVCNWEIPVRAGASAKVGSHGAAPTAQRTGATQAAVTCVSQTISDPPTQSQTLPLAAVTLRNESRATGGEIVVVLGG